MLLSGTLPFCQNKLLVLDGEGIVNSNKCKFEPNCDLVDQDYTHYNENLINGQLRPTLLNRN